MRQTILSVLREELDHTRSRDSYEIAYRGSDSDVSRTAVDRLIRYRDEASQDSRRLRYLVWCAVLDAENGGSTRVRTETVIASVRKGQEVSRAEAIDAIDDLRVHGAIVAFRVSNESWIQSVHCARSEGRAAAWLLERMVWT